MGLFILGRLMPDVHPGCEGAPLSGGIPRASCCSSRPSSCTTSPKAWRLACRPVPAWTRPTASPWASLCRMCRKGWWWRWCWPESVCRVSRRCWSVPRRAWSSRCSRCSAPGWSASPRCSCPGAGRRGGSDALRGHHEIIPESHRQGHAAEATLGLVFGFCPMMVLDTALGWGLIRPALN